MIDLYYPLRSLREGHWFKLICGASFQHLPAVRNLVLAYTLAGADCIDVAADPAVISTAKAALNVAVDIALKTDRGSLGRGLPWLMVSLNDGEDPHFRKAKFDATACPSDCVRPCETICPAQAIVFHSPLKHSTVSETLLECNVSEHSIAAASLTSGVISDRCYGCGRCLPICPIQQITTRSYVSTPAAIAPLILQTGVDAIEIHTQVGRVKDFSRLWDAIEPWVSNLKLVAISCPDGEGLIDYLWSLYDIISPLPCPLIWQMDGRPMSGDIGAGTTRAAVKLGQKVLAAGLPDYIQLAGGTNHHTVPKLETLGLLHSALSNPLTIAADGNMTTAPLEYSSASDRKGSHIAGIAYGSYARALLAPVLNQLDALTMAAIEPTLSTIADASQPQRQHRIEGFSQSRSSHTVREHALPMRLEEAPDLLWQAVGLAESLISQLKAPSRHQSPRLNL